MGFEKYVENVYFHPDFQFIDRDGQTVFIFDDDGNVVGTSDEMVTPVSYARRSPYPTVNILRSHMVETAQVGIPKGKIFYSNKARLEQIGTPKLQEMLDKRDWTDLNQVSIFY